jgi:hypothetical protein
MPIARGLEGLAKMLFRIFSVSSVCGWGDGLSSASFSGALGTGFSFLLPIHGKLCNSSLALLIGIRLSCSMYTSVLAAQLVRVRWRLRAAVTGCNGLPADAPFGTKEITFRPGKTDVDVYKHLDLGVLIHTRGTNRLADMLSA